MSVDAEQRCSNKGETEGGRRKWQKESDSHCWVTQLCEARLRFQKRCAVLTYSAVWWYTCIPAAVHSNHGDLTLSPPLRDPPSHKQSPSLYPLILSAVPPSGPVTAIPGSICVSRFMSQKEQLAALCDPLPCKHKPEVQRIKQAFYLS